MHALATTAAQDTPSAGIVLFWLISTGLYIWAVVVCFMKGRPGFGITGLFIGIFAIVGALRLAKPDSSWARNRYRGTSSHKMAAARVRFPDNAAAADAKDRALMAPVVS